MTTRTVRAKSNILPHEESQLPETQLTSALPPLPGAVVASMNTDVGVMPLIASTKDFKTGSRGFFGIGKVAISGRRYQYSLQLVEIGSKGK